MSRHYGTDIEPDKEPSPELEYFYENLFWDADKAETELYYQTHTKDGTPVSYEAERAEYLEER